MRTTLALSLIEGGIICLWLFAFRNAIQTPKQLWYLGIPSLFLILPVVGVLVALRLGRAEAAPNGYTIYFALVLALVANGCAFYGMLSGGGV